MITVLADTPGVKAQDLEIDLCENVLTLTGRVSQPAPGGADVCAGRI
jgi:HSP20 family molecular chaperone IbpA